MPSRDISEMAAAALRACRDAGLTVATAESCTGGLIAAALTGVAGSSDVVDRGFVTYSNAAKTEMIGVPAPTIAGHGAVSEPVARAMAKGALARSGAGLAVAVTGIAGPGGGTPDKPVGRVHLCVAARTGAIRHLQRDYGAIGREAVRLETVRDALALLREMAAGVGSSQPAARVGSGDGGSP